MDRAQSLYELIKKHLQFTDNNYNGPVLPKDKATEFVKDLQAFVSDTHKLAKQEGQAEMLVGLMELFDNITKEKMKELYLQEDRARSIKSYFNWERNFERDKNKLP